MIGFKSILKTQCLIILVALLSRLPSVYGEAPPCFKEIESHFFRDDLVAQALSIQNVAQSNWAIIIYELKKRAIKVPDIVRKRANSLIPNPLNDPYDPVASQALLEEVLQQILAETLSLFNINSRIKIGEIYGYIKDKQIDKFNRCFVLPVQNHGF